VSVSRESKRLRKSNNWLNSDNALIQHLSENAIFVFPHFTRQCKSTSYLRWHILVKRLLIAYLIGNISGKNIKIRSFTCVKVIAAGMGNAL